MTYDEIWNYGFSYNIANGLLPYKDFNMVITPLFPFLGAFFLILFGDSLVIYHIFNALVCTAIFYLMKKTTPKCYYVPYAILLLNALPSYNLLCIFLLYLLIIQEEKAHNDYAIGITLGLTFLTKQNIGIYLCIPTLFTKNFKKIFKRIIGFLIPNFLLVVYLLTTDSIMPFIDYVFLGMNSFLEKNIDLNIGSLLITIVTLVGLIYKYIKTKELRFIYLICFQGLVFPLIDFNHVLIAFVPALAYLLNDLKLITKVVATSFYLYIVGVFSYNLYLYNTNHFLYPNNSKVYKYRKIEEITTEQINMVSDYIKELDGKVYINYPFAYLVKLENNIVINKYDLLNDGNLGKNGQYRIIEELKDACQKEKCTFLNPLDPMERNVQYNQEILDYVRDNYTVVDNLNGIGIYSN